MKRSTSSPRSIHELLNSNPNLQDMRKTFENEFIGMTEYAVSYDELVEIRYYLIKHLLEVLTINERKFLLSIKMGEPDWSVMLIDGIQNLPVLAWKIMNIKKMDKKKHEIALANLKKVLSI